MTKFIDNAALAIAPFAMLAGCATTGAATVASPKTDAPSPVTTSAPVTTKGLEAVMGQDSAALTRLFGEPRLDVKEVNSRKLQFTGKACILDAYLYPEGQGGKEIVTHVDARRKDGAAVDRAACVNALRRR